MKTEMKIRLADIKPLAVHDGPGIRTTFFLKGCPLRCRWCHNPECISGLPELLFRRRNCTGCGTCVTVCPNGVHRFVDGEHRIERDRCTSCGYCTDACLPGALQLCGLEYTLGELVELAREDADFYRVSDGGVTLSGGEPLLHAEFCHAFFRELRGFGIHRAIDTCGAVPFEAFETVLSETDLFLYDLKQIDDAAHRAGTGVSNCRILENLRILSASGARIEIRMPLIPGYNMDDGTLRRSGEFLASLQQIPPVRLLAYHPYAHEKYRTVGCPDSMPEEEMPPPETMAYAAALLTSCGVPVIEPKQSLRSKKAQEMMNGQL